MKSIYLAPSMLIFVTLHRPTAVLVPGYLELISYEFDALNSIMALVFA
jgi:hypothetical protein